MAPTPEEQGSLEDILGRFTSAYLEAPREARLIGPGGQEIPLTGSAFEALAAVLDYLGRGQAVTLVPHEHELTTQEAADLLHISRTYLIKLLDRDELPYERRGKHRRLKASDVLEYRRRRARARRDKLAELTRLSDEYGGYDV